MVIASIVVIILLSNFNFLQNKQLMANDSIHRLLMLQKLDSISDGIQSDFNTSLQYADFFDVIISKDSQMTEATIDDYARLILEQNKNIESVQLAPDGIVSIIYPLEGNEAALGHDLLDDPARKDFVQKAITTKKAVTQGPVKAKQGGYLVFNRKAIFINENGEDKFWGLSIISIDFNQLIDKYKQTLKSDGYLLALKAEQTDGQDNFLWGDSEIFEKGAITKKIVLPDNEWEIAIYPEAGWIQKNDDFQSIYILYYLITLLVFVLIYRYVNIYQEKLEAAKRDFLTGTFNKSAFEAFTYKQFLKKGYRHGIILMDLNDFKQINDQFGHPFGDTVLIEVANRIQKIMRNTDRVSRFGGDEYIIFINRIKDEETVKQVMSRIVQTISKPMMIDDLQLNISISAGYAIYPDEGKTFEELYSIADQNMYKNKNTFK